MSATDTLHVGWSHPLSQEANSLLQGQELHGTPVMDFMQHFRVSGVSFPAVHPALQEESLSMVNSLSHFPLWEELHFIVSEDVPENHFVLSSLGMDPEAGVDGDAGPASPFTHALLEAKLQPENNPNLSASQLQQLRELCLEFESVFSMEDELGCFPPELLPKFKIEMKEGAVPKMQRAYKLSKFEEDWLLGELMKLVKLQAVRRCQGTPLWVSPVVIAKHPRTGALRVCIDMRYVNSCTIPMSVAVPRVDEVINKMKGCTYYSHLDVRKGFWHMPIEEEDCHKTAFATPWGVYEFVRCPFGLINAPAAYQRCMDTVFEGLDSSKTYRDDTFCFTKSWEDHLQTLRSVLERCVKYGVKLNWEKCNFGVATVKCLGYIVSSKGVEVDPDKVEAILQLPQPQCPTDVKSFLGMAGYFRHFIDGFASVSAPLSNLTKKSVRFVWTPECQAAFDKLKIALVSAPCLWLPDWSKPFILHVDWSKKAVGAYLSQQDDEGREYPVAFASRLMTPAEQNYAPVEGECLALVWATHKFRYYLHGRKFLVHTDHKSLEWLQSTRFDNSKVERWALRLQEFHFDIVYKKGSDNVVADCLSRSCAAQLLPNSRVVRPHCAFSICAGWPTAAHNQAQLDAIACSVCDHPGGWDNMAICSKCEACYHLRCVFPPMSTVPSGDWLCPGCDPVFRNREELCDPNTPLRYRPGDPYLNSSLLVYLEGGMADDLLPADRSRARALSHMATSVKLHPAWPGWLMVQKKLRKHGTVWLTCPPVQYRWDLLRVYHDALGHCGTSQLMACMQSHFRWRGIREDVEKFVRACDACQRRKLALPELPDLQQPVVQPGPFKHVHIDLAGPFDTPLISIHGKITELKPPAKPVKAHVVLMIDYFSKAAEFYVIYSKHAHQAAEAFYNGWLCRYGCPEFVTSDNGTEFDAEFAHMVARLGIKHVHTSACHPAANGAVERLVRSFKDILRKFVNDHPVHWVKAIPQVRMAYVARLHRALGGVSPFEMLHGCQPRLAAPIGVQLASLSIVDSVEAQEYLAALQERFARLDKQALAMIERQFAQNKADWQRRRSDFSRKACHALHPGDLVLEVDDHPDSALNAVVRGPYCIVELIMDGAVAVLQTGSTHFKSGVAFNRHVSRLAKYYDKYSA